MTVFDYLSGVYNITPTPFLDNGDLDPAGIRQLTEFVIGTGVQGMTILGVLGEAHKVSDSERDLMISTVLETANGRIPICVGATHASTTVCIQYCRRAEELGAQAVMVAPPRLSRSNDEALRKHYLSIADAVDIPIVVQDHPPSSGVLMGVSFLAALAGESAQCRFVKLEDEPTPAKISKVLAANPNVQIFGGTGGLMLLEELRHGAMGTMTGFSYPEVLVEICHKFLAGDRDGAAQTFYRFCPLIRFENQPLINLAIRKRIYYLRGALPTPSMRPPFPALDEITIEDLDDILQRLDLQRTLT